MAHGRRLSRFEIVGWTALGIVTGLVAGFGLSELVGGVSPRRLRGMVTEPPPRPRRQLLSAAATARAACAALDADPTLCELGLRPPRWRSASSSCTAGCRRAPSGRMPVGLRAARYPASSGWSTASW